MNFHTWGIYGWRRCEMDKWKHVRVTVHLWLWMIWLFDEYWMRYSNSIWPKNRKIFHAFTPRRQKLNRSRKPSTKNTMCTNGVALTTANGNRQQEKCTELPTWRFDVLSGTDRKENLWFRFWKYYNQMMSMQKGASKVKLYLDWEIGTQQHEQLNTVCNAMNEYMPACIIYEPWCLDAKKYLGERVAPSHWQAN